MSNVQEYIDLYNKHYDAICKPCSRSLNEHRDAAFRRFEKLGFPQRKQEEYRYTDIDTLFGHDYGLNLNRLNFPVNPYESFRCDVPNLSTSLYFVVNDTFFNKALPATHLPEGVILGSLNQLVQEYPDKFENYYNRLAEKDNDAVTAFNTAFLQDGFCIYVPDNVVIDKPVQLINILRSDVDLMLNRRVLVILGNNSKLRLLVCDHAMDKVKFLATQVIEAFVGENSQFYLCELEETHTSSVRLSSLYVSQQANSSSLLTGITLTNGITRNVSKVYLKGEGAETNLAGLATTDKNQHIDNHTYVEHTVPHCTSKELYKYVLDDSSTGAFAGSVVVYKDAQKSVSQQTNRNLCLTPEAHVYSQPQLEIYADDVKCSHGATVGQLDENALFYMQQRGIGIEEARLLLVLAFVNEVIDVLEIDVLKDRLHFLVEKRLRGELDKCQGCTLCK